MKINEHKNMLNFYKSVFNNVFELLNLDVNFTVELFCFNLITEHSFFIDEDRNNDIEDIESEIKNRLFVLEPNSKAFVSEQIFREEMDKFLLRIVLVINTYDDLNKNFDVTLIEYVIKEVFTMLERNSDISQVIHVAGDMVLKKIAHELMCDFSLSEQFNAISSLKYETAEINSNLLLTNALTIAKMEIDVRFEDYVALSSYKIMRKLLEVAKEDMFLIGTGKEFFGFISQQHLDAFLNENSLSDIMPLYKVKLKNTLNWEIQTIKDKSTFIPVIESKFTKFSYPFLKITKEKLDNKIKGVFDDYDIDALWSIVNAAIEQKHGTMVIISKEANEESERLKRCSINIKQTKTYTKTIS